jgi:hypothetical protein
MLGDRWCRFAFVQLTRILSVPEFGMPAEDWVSVSVRRGSDEDNGFGVATPPADLAALHKQAENIASISILCNPYG